MAFLSAAAKGVADDPFNIERTNNTGGIIALVGNPNVGKSTVFNMLTGMNQHTGNWPGKTVGSARGVYRHRENEYILIDLPGTYSLAASSQEEEIARDFILFGGADACIVVCDATCLERNLNLVLQTAEIAKNVVLCLNLMDEAEKKGIHIDVEALEARLGIPVAATSARSGDGLKELAEKVSMLIEGKVKAEPASIGYPAELTQAAEMLVPALEEELKGRLDSRWLALRLLDGDNGVIAGIKAYLDIDIASAGELELLRRRAGETLTAAGITLEELRDMLAGGTVKTAERVSAEVIGKSARVKDDRDKRIDKLLTSKATGIPVMLLLLGVIFWLTITGANYPSELLSKGLFWVEDRLTELFMWLRAPEWLHGALVLGVYRVLAWVVSVMLPPMAIFFPLFTLLEDFGYLPRVAFNLDHQFKKACACGKQALTMWVGNICIKEKSGSNLPISTKVSRIVGTSLRM